MNIRKNHINKFYELLNKLIEVEPKRYLNLSNGRMNWCSNGVYFFYEKSELREKVVDEFKSLVFGPRGGDDEFIEGSGRVVALRYLTGILFPQGEKRSDLAADDESFSEEDGKREVKTREDFSGDSDNPLSMANEELPSSVGITFVIKKNEMINESGCDKIDAAGVKFINVFSY